MVASARAGQTVRPPYAPGPNADDGADVTAAVIPLHDSPTTSITVQADHTGVLTTTLPRNYIWKRLRGTIDVSSTATWSIEDAVGCTATVTSSGQVSLTGVTAASGSFVVQSVRDGTTVRTAVSVTRNDAAPPQSGSSGGTSASSSAAFATTSDTFAVISEELVFETGSSGEAALSAALTLDVQAAAPASASGWDVECQWEIKEGAGSYSDVGTALGETVKPLINVEEEGGIFFYTDSDGSLSANITATGLTANTEHTARLKGRRVNTPVKSINYIGTRSATGS